MKKPLIITIIGIFSTLATLFVAALVVGFTIVVPTTEAINTQLAKDLAKIVAIPQFIPSPALSFDQTSYLWEMETREGEVTPVRFHHDTAFSKDQKEIKAVLELPQGGDPSIFVKVLPAVITDEKSLRSAQDPQKADLSPNPNAGYKQISIRIREETKQTTKITWEFEKSALSPQLQNLYAKLAVYPPTLLRFLYHLPKVTLEMLSG